MKYVANFLLFALALPAEPPAGRILRIQISTIADQTIVGARVVAQTPQEAVSGAGGLTVLRLPLRLWTPRSELNTSASLTKNS